MACVLSSKAEWRSAGDANNDKKLSIADLVIIVDILRGNSPMPKDISLYDANGDKKLDLDDVAFLAEVLAGKQEPVQVWKPETIPVGGGDQPFD